MMKMILERRYFSWGINGILSFNNKEICKTIELPWKNNQRRISCIPEGVYRIGKRFSQKFKWHIEVMNVKNRDLILFHPANDALKELNGCIAPVSELTGEGKGIRSRVAFERLKEIVFPYLEKGFVIELIIKKINSMKKVIERIQEPTPKFFKMIRNIGLVLTAVSGVIATAPVSLPAVVVTVAGYMAVAGGIASAISQTAVYRDN